MHAALFPISGQSQDQDALPWDMDTVQFIAFFSKINIVRNALVARVATARWFEEAEAMSIVATGNTRDMRTPYYYPCDNKKYGCQHKIHNPQDLQKHFQSCKVTSKEAAVEAYSEKSITGTVSGCTKSFRTEEQRTKHHYNCHSCTP